jgi:hypothetical protein
MSEALFGEDGDATLERRRARPTLELNGMGGGYLCLTAASTASKEVRA